MADINIEKKPRSSTIPIILVLAAIGLLVWLFTQKDDSTQRQDRTVGARPQAVSLAPAPQIRTLLPPATGASHHTALRIG